jgi:hypothetical protein
MNGVYSSVLERGNPVFDMVGTYLYHNLKETDRIKISNGMLCRLIAYAEKELGSYGFPSHGQVRVELTIDHGDKLSDGFFSVGFQNEKGGTVGVQGIVIKNAWPFLNHGFFLATE